jgi:hypothetical protein
MFKFRKPAATAATDPPPARPGGPLAERAMDCSGCGHSFNEYDLKALGGRVGYFCARCRQRRAGGATRLTGGCDGCKQPVYRSSLKTLPGHGSDLYCPACREHR